jgi:hypothetical protein
MNKTTTYSAFVGDDRIAVGALEDVLARAFEVRQTAAVTTTTGAADGAAQILFFRNDTGGQVDFDLHGSLEDVLGRAVPPERSPGQRKGPGRPRLGVQCGEVCLMPRHWEWLEWQPKRASATLRLLVEQAMKNMSPQDRAQVRIEAAHKFMWAMAGDRSGFEEASRALYAGKWDVFDALIALWPDDIVAQLQEMLKEARGLTGPTEKTAGEVGR